MSYRKLWEWAAILEVLSSRQMLQAGRKGLGFAVGQEKLPSVMASFGVNVLATDLDLDKVNTGWVETGQHASSLDSLFFSDLVSADDFKRHVNFMPADMNELAHFPGNEFDFIWSSCAFEHLGSLSKGLDFVENAMRLLKPGGIAVHTTEYNISSNDDTIEDGWDCIYRQQDIERLDRKLRLSGCGIEKVDFDAGHHPFDLCYDSHPFFQPGRVHIKLLVGGYVCTSTLLVIHKT